MVQIKLQLELIAGSTTSHVKVISMSLPILRLFKPPYSHAGKAVPHAGAAATCNPWKWLSRMKTGGPRPPAAAALAAAA